MDRSRHADVGEVELSDPLRAGNGGNGHANIVEPNAGRDPGGSTTAGDARVFGSRGIQLNVTVCAWAASNDEFLVTRAPPAIWASSAALSSRV